MVRLHMVDYKIIDIPIPYGFRDGGYEFILESMLHGINQSYLLVNCQIRIIAHS